MGGNLGDRSATGVQSNTNRVLSGAWVVTFTPAMLPSESDFEVWHGAAKGPGGYFHVYIDDKFYGVGANGLINEYTPTIPMYVRKGQSISLHWSTPNLPAPLVWLYFRQPEVGRI